MQAHYPSTFEREMGCTTAEWLMWLPDAVGPWPLTVQQVPSAPHGQARAEPYGGTLELRWQVLSDRVLGLVRLPRLRVHYAFESISEQDRQHFMRRFDLYMQRGGG